MSLYSKPNRFLNYFFGLGSTPTQNELYRSARELKQGGELEAILRNLETRKAVKSASNLLIDLFQIGNLYWGYENGTLNLNNFALTEIARLVLDSIFCYADRKNLKKVKEELSQIKPQSWNKILEEAGKRLDER